MGTGKQYDEEFKKQAIKLARDVGNTAAAKELVQEVVIPRSHLILHSSFGQQTSK